MQIAYLGNFVPPASTENHVARAWENNGHTVTRCQEGDEAVMHDLATGNLSGVDLILWTRTKSLTAPARDSYRMLAHAADSMVPVVGLHLDIWWGLKRENEIFEDPFFRVPLLITADGGHDKEWAEAGVNHYWMPPGISRDETLPGMWRSDLSSPLAFVGSWDGGYHPESEHRHALVRWLKTNFTRDCAFWPRPGEHAIRGADLRDLYASVDVVVGDSCFTGTGLKKYVSDRLPETMGRAGFLIHPRVQGVTDGSKTEWVPMWQEGEHLLCWDANNWDQLGEVIEWALSHPDERTQIQAQGRAHTMEWHTYEHRITNLIDVMINRGMLPRPAPSKVAKEKFALVDGATPTTKGGTKRATPKASAKPAGKGTKGRSAR